MDLRDVVSNKYPNMLLQRLHTYYGQRGRWHMSSWNVVSKKKKKKVMNLVVTTSIDYDKQRIADGWMR
jgi:hypothetical protein